ncbi:MAG: hypothetical protein AAF290_13575 [Pseudomonadota bacterium]
MPIPIGHEQLTAQVAAVEAKLNRLFEHPRFDELATSEIKITAPSRTASAPIRAIRIRDGAISELVGDNTALSLSADAVRIESTTKTIVANGEMQVETLIEVWQKAT